MLPPEIPSGRTVAPALADIPNPITIPLKESVTVIAYRVFQAFPGYGLGGSVDATNTPFPSVYAINYETGKRSTAANTTPCRPRLVASQLIHRTSIISTERSPAGYRRDQIAER